MLPAIGSKELEDLLVKTMAQTMAERGIDLVSADGGDVVLKCRTCGRQYDVLLLNGGRARYLCPTGCQRKRRRREAKDDQRKGD